MTVARRVAATIGCLGALCLALSLAPAAGAVGLPEGFQDTVAFEGLKEPSAFRFAPDGRVFVAEKQGLIVVFDDMQDTTPTVFADLRKQVYDYGDKGVLGLALDPEFPTRPYVYVLYTFNHELGVDPPGAYPAWAQEDGSLVGDPSCAGRAPAVDACPVSGRLVRLTAVGDHAEEDADGLVEHPLIAEAWCQQSSSHSIGDLEFGPEGALFASGGEGAIFTTADYGQFGWPDVNECGDPPGSRGQASAPPDAEGGSLRSQDLLTAGDPTGLSGTVIRIDPDTGAPLPGNPQFGDGPDENAERIIAFGFRNPFRFAIQAETGEVYVDNVGGGPYEEIDRFATTPDPAYNSGWPCYEADEPNPVFSVLELNLCKRLYEDPDSTARPFFFYNHHFGVTPGDQCPHEEGSAISGSAFYDGDEFPSAYDDALFFSDAVRGCIYVMFPGADGRPDPSTVVPFLTETGKYEFPAVDVQVGPDGALYYSSLFGRGGDFGLGAIHRIGYSSGNQPPVARVTATPQWGPAPLESDFDASTSTDSDGEALEYAWDLDEDGAYDDGTGATSETTFSGHDNHTIAVRVEDEQGATSVARVTVYPGDSPPAPQIDAPLQSLTWDVGQPIEFSGSATDPDEPGGSLPSTSLDWATRLYHCPGGASSCHAHPLQAFPAVDSGTLIAPDHDYPSHIEFRLTATDSRGLSTSTAVSVDPRAVVLKIASDPAGIALGAGFVNGPAPFDFTAIEGSAVTLSAPESVMFSGAEYTLDGWSDSGDAAHTVTAGDGDGEYLATYTKVEPPDEEPPDEEEPPNEEPPGEEPPKEELSGGEPPGAVPPAPIVPALPTPIVPVVPIEREEAHRAKPVHCHGRAKKKRVGGKVRCVRRKRRGPHRP